MGSFLPREELYSLCSAECGTQRMKPSARELKGSPSLEAASLETRMEVVWARRQEVDQMSSQDAYLAPTQQSAAWHVEKLKQGTVHFHVAAVWEV